MVNIKIDKELQNLIPPLADDEIKQLENNLLKEGWRDNERIITWNGIIVDGHNRYSVCTKHNIPFKVQEKKFADKNAVILWMIDNQIGRRNIPDYARIELNLRKEDILKLIAKQQQVTHTEQGYQKSDKAIHVNKEIAKASKVSHDTVGKVKFIRDNADEETKAKLRSGNKELSINKVYTNLKRREKRKQIILDQTPKKLKEKYEIIYADPPWSYNRNVGEGIASEEYSTLPLVKIKTFLEDNKIKVEDNAMLFLWVTFPLLKEGLEVMESWGFKYKTCGFNWIKLNKNKEPFFGIGHYTKSNSELCLLGIKGKGLTILDDTVSQIIMTEKERHSKKPDEVPEKIIKLVGDRKRVELFARKKREGWDVYGDEVKENEHSTV